MKKDIKFFKIFYSFQPDWTIEEAAYLACGKKPYKKNRKKPLSQKTKMQIEHLSNSLKYDISKTKTKPTYKPRIDKEFLDLHNKRSNRKSNDNPRDEVERYATQYFLEAFRNLKFKYDADLERALYWAKKTHFEKFDNKYQIDESFYLSSSKKIADIYGDIPNSKMAKILRTLVKKLNKKYNIFIPLKSEDSIKEYLRGNSNLAGPGRPKKSDTEPELDWKLILSKFKV